MGRSRRPRSWLREACRLDWAAGGLHSGNCQSEDGAQTWSICPLTVCVPSLGWVSQQPGITVVLNLQMKKLRLREAKPAILGRPLRQDWGFNSRCSDSVGEHRAVSGSRRSQGPPLAGRGEVRGEPWARPTPGRCRRTGRTHPRPWQSTHSVLACRGRRRRVEREALPGGPPSSMGSEPRRQKELRHHLLVACSGL